MNRLFKACVLTSAITFGTLQAQSPLAWHDASPHKVQFVTVEEGVRLEVLDWGGSGRNVVLLAGSGNTAHVFDDFAPKLSHDGHVYGITRRGYGASSHPDSGYSEERLAQDVLQVIGFFKMVSPVLMGHSMSGEELTRLGDEHSDLLAGLIYLDAASDPKDWPGSSPAYMALFQKLPEPMRTQPQPTPADKTSFHVYYEWQLHNRDAPFPEAELHNQYEENPDGSVGKLEAWSRIHKAIGAGAQKRDYSKIGDTDTRFFSSRGHGVKVST